MKGKIEYKIQNIKFESLYDQYIVYHIKYFYKKIDFFFKGFICIKNNGIYFCLENFPDYRMFETWIDITALFSLLLGFEKRNKFIKKIDFSNSLESDIKYAKELLFNQLDDYCEKLIKEKTKEEKKKKKALLNDNLIEEFLKNESLNDEAKEIESVFKTIRSGKEDMAKLTKRIKEAREKPGGSNVGKYPKIKDFAGPSGGSPEGSFPIDTKKHAKSAIKLAHNAKNPAGIIKAVFAKFPSLMKGSKFDKEGKVKK